MDYLHYGTMFSYYSAKTRAVMSFKRIPFVEVYDPRELSGRIQEATSKRMIPVLVAPDGEILQDTTVIVDALEARFPDRPVFPADSAMMLLSRIAEFFIDELWITTAMNTRWNDPVSKAFAIGEFGRGIGEAHGLEGEAAMAIGQRVADQMQSYLPYLGIGTEDGQRIASQFFRTATLKLNNVVGKDRYALGSRPWLIDFVLFEGYYAHHYRDAGAAQQFLEQEAPQLCYYLDALHAGHCIAPEGEPGISDALVDYLSYVGPSAAAFGAALELQA